MGCGSSVFIRTFEPTMTHDELEPIMATLGFYHPSVLHRQHSFPFEIPHAIHCSKCFLNFVTLILMWVESAE